MKRFKGAGLITCIIILFACNKNDTIKPSPDNGGKDSVTQLKKIGIDADRNISFEYNSKNMLSKTKDVRGGTADAREYLYNEGKLTSLVYPGKYKTNVFYTNGKISKVDLVNIQNPDNETVYRYMKFTYSGEFISKIEQLYDDQNQTFPGPRKEFEYYGNGDVKKITTWGYISLTKTFFLASVITYEYDNRQNPLYAHNKFTPWLHDNFDDDLFAYLPSKHNVTKRSIYNHKNELVSTCDIVYTYNNKNYPLKAKQTEHYTGEEQQGDVIRNITYEYLQYYFNKKKEAFKLLGGFLFMEIIFW